MPAVVILRVKYPGPRSAELLRQLESERDVRAIPQTAGYVPVAMDDLDPAAAYDALKEVLDRTDPSWPDHLELRAERGLRRILSVGGPHAAYRGAHDKTTLPDHPRRRARRRPARRGGDLHGRAGQVAARVLPGPHRRVGAPPRQARRRRARGRARLLRVRLVPDGPGVALAGRYVTAKPIVRASPTAMQ